MRRAQFDPGALRHRLTLLRPVETPDGCGGIQVTWENVATVWAALTPVRARSFLEAQQDKDEVRMIIHLRHRDDVEAGWQCTIGERILEIETIHDPDQRRCYLECEARERSA